MDSDGQRELNHSLVLLAQNMNPKNLTVCSLKTDNQQKRPEYIKYSPQK